MPVTFINGIVVDLPVRFEAGQVIDEAGATILTEIYLGRMRSRLNHLLKQGTINKDGLQRKALELSEKELSVRYIENSEEDDPIAVEALIIARDLIVARMTAEHMPLPANLDNHAQALVNAMPEIRERARARVELRYSTTSGLLLE